MSYMISSVDMHLQERKLNHVMAWSVVHEDQYCSACSAFYYPRFPFYASLRLSVCPRGYICTLSFPLLQTSTDLF